MGLLQKLFKRNKTPVTESTEDTTETMNVEINDGKADVAPVKEPAAKKAATKTAAAKPAAKATAATTTKQCAATTKAGSQCKRASVGRSKFCTTHKN